MGSGIGVVFAIVYFLVVTAIAVMAVWALVLVIIFLRLRIAQLRAGPGDAAP